MWNPCLQTVRMHCINLSLLHLYLPFAIFFFRHAVICSRGLGHPYINPSPGGHTLMFMMSASHFPSKWWPRWALRSQNPILTPIGEDGEKLRWFGGIKEPFKMLLMSQRISLAIFLYLTPHSLTHGKGSVSPPNLDSQPQYSGCHSVLCNLSPLSSL